MSVPIARNTAGQEVYFFLFSGADINLTPTIAAGDFQISIDGGAFANLATLPTVTPAAGGQVRVQLSQAETNGVSISIRAIDQAGGAWDDVSLTFRTTVRTVDDLLHSSEVYEGTLTHKEIVRILLAALAGLSTGGGTASVAFRDVGDTKDRIAATVTVNGNRTVIALDGS